METSLKIRRQRQTLNRPEFPTHQPQPQCFQTIMTVYLKIIARYLI